jgi:hypothetical protein
MAVSVPFYATWDDDGLRRAQRDVDSFGQGILGSIGKLAGPLAAVGGAIAGAFAGAQLVGFAKDAIDSATNIGEQLSKLNVLIPESSGKFDEWSNTTAKALGIAKGDALEAAGNFVNLFRAAGKVGDEGIAASQTFVKLASGMASFNNASPEETLAALESGLRGEFEPLRKYGVLLDDATLRQKAFEKGIIASERDALTPQQKTLAAYEAILSQTTVQIDDFTRTSDSAANKQRALAAQFEDVKTKIGTALQPAFEVLLDLVETKLLPAFERFANWMVENKDEIAAFFERLVTAAEEMWTELGPQLEKFGKVFRDDVAPVLDAFVKGEWTQFFTKLTDIVTGSGKTKTDAAGKELGSSFGGAVLDGIFNVLSDVNFWKIIGRLLYNGMANSIFMLPAKAARWLAGQMGFDTPNDPFTGDLARDFENFKSTFGFGPDTNFSGGSGAPPELIGFGAAGGVNITVNGALDPVGVANQISDLLSQQNARLGVL